MKRILTALTWEYWREHRLWLASVFIGACALIVIPLGEKPSLSFYQECNTQYVILLIEFAGITWFIIKSHFNDDSTRLGFPESLYLTPVATFVLVGWRMFLVIATGAIVHATTVGILFILLGLRWPLLGPILFLSMVLCVSLTLVWLTVNIRYVQTILGCILALGILSLYNTIFRVDNLLLGKPTSMWSANLLSNYLAMLVVIIIAYGISIWVVRRDRRGNLAYSVWTRTFLLRLLSFRFRDITPQYRRPQSALLWLFWHRTGWVFPGINLAAVIICIIIYASGLVHHGVLAGLYFVMIFTNLIPMPFLIGIASGQMNPKTWEMSFFEATHPIHNNTLLAVRFKCAFSALISAWAVLLAGIGIIDLLSHLRDHKPIMFALIHGLLDTLLTYFSGGTLTIEPSSILILLGLYFLLVWSAIGLSVSAVLTGRRRLVIKLCLSSCLALSVIATLIKIMFPDISLLTLSKEIAIYSTSLCSLIGTITLFSFAYQRRRIQFTTLFFSALIYLLLAIVSSLFLGDMYQLTLKWYILILGLLALPVAPFAAAPLAIACNRYR